MPKERVHWITAGESLRLLPQGALKDLLNDQREYFLLGAVAPDTVFMPGILGASHRRASHYFHGDGNYCSFRYWREAPREWLENPSILAFLYGVTLHMVVDSCFHPAVFYFTGWKNHQNRNVARHSNANHYRLEALLDLFLQNYYAYPSKKNELNKILSKVNLKLISPVASRVFFPDHNLSEKSMERMFRRHGVFQAIYDCSLLRILAWILRILHIELKGLRNMIYRRPLRDWNDKLLLYRHPVTGETMKGGWKDLAHFSVKQSIVYLQSIDGHIKKGSLKMLEEGPLADRGIPSQTSKDRDFKYSGVCIPRELFL